MFLSLAELCDAVEEILPALKEKGITVYLLSDECTTDGIQCIGQAIAKASDKPLSPSLRSNIHIRSTALYIYTSGTTGICQGLCNIYCYIQFNSIPNQADTAHKKC